MKDAGLSPHMVTDQLEQLSPIIALHTSISFIHLFPAVLLRFRILNGKRACLFGPKKCSVLSWHLSLLNSNR